MYNGISMIIPCLIPVLTPFQIFSAPNYVDQAGNKGAFVRLLARNTYPGLK